MRSENRCAVARAFVLLAFVVSPALGAFAGTPPAARQVLAQAKQASGGASWDGVSTIRFAAHASGQGLTGPAVDWVAPGRGRWAVRLHLGPGLSAEGFDGRRGWSRGPNGEVTTLDSADAQAQAISRAYVRTFGWWFPQRWKATLKFVGTKRVAGTLCDVVRATPAGGVPVRIWVNVVTHRIVRVSAPGPFGPTTTRYADYRPVHGLLLPFRIRTDPPRGGALRMRVQSVRVNAPPPAGVFFVPKEVFHDVTFAGSAASAGIPFRLLNNHIYVHAAIDAHPLQLLVDTGGANVVTPAAARALGIHGRGALRGHGVGRKSVQVSVARVRRLSLGGKVTLHRQVFYVMPLTGMSAVEGTAFPGLVGFEVFKRFVVRIDYARRILTLIRPGAFSPRGAGTPVPFTFSGHDPQIRGSLDGIPGQFTIDTGSRSSLTLWAPFVKKHHLLRRYRATPETVVGWGVGGRAEARVARADTFQMGSVPVKDPVIELPPRGQGASANRDIAGNIGGAILRRFTVTLDYRHRVMYLKPNATYGRPMDYDRSGLWINRGRSGFVVAAVMPGGPAAVAGLMPGDTITAVDGTPADKLVLSSLRSKLRSSPLGTRVTFRVLRAGSPHAVTVVLRDLLPDG